VIQCLSKFDILVHVGDGPFGIYMTHKCYPNYFIACPYLQQDATHAAYQELGHNDLRSRK
jgi:hypothetical protein